MIVIADATPLNYLILIDQAELLPRLFDRILIPPAVFEELQHQETPDVVRRWIARPPSWLHVPALRSVLDPALGLIQESGKPSPSRRSFTPISFCSMMPTLAAKRLGAACLSSGHWRLARSGTPRSPRSAKRSGSIAGDQLLCRSRVD
jgi:hypothetical protein